MGTTTNYKLLLSLTLIKPHICTFFSKENLFVLCSLLNNLNYFWIKHSNLPFLAICCSQFPLWYSLGHPDNKKQNLRCEWTCGIKKMIVILKGFIKQPVIKQCPFFLSFSFLIDCCMSVFFFPYQSVCKFWKIDKISSYIKIEKIWKYWWKYFVWNLKLKTFFVGQPSWPTYSTPLFKISGSVPDFQNILYKEFAYFVSLARKGGSYMFYTVREKQPLFVDPFYWRISSMICFQYRLIFEYQKSLKDFVLI